MVVPVTCIVVTWVKPVVRIRVAVLGPKRGVEYGWMASSTVLTINRSSEKVSNLRQAVLSY